MKTYVACIVVLVMGCCVVRADDAAATAKIVKTKVEEMNDAMIKEDFGKIADLTYPKVVELMGGRDKMISMMESGTKDMKSKGFTFKSCKVEDPSDPVKSGSDLFVVVPFQLEIKAPGGKLLAKSFVIGVSSDQGKNWGFVNGDLDGKKVKQVLPNLPEELKLPEREKPEFVKD
jgi:hypothetical protein